MIKPITVAKAELEQELVKTINKYQTLIPAFVTRDILRKLDAQLEKIESQQLSNDLDLYNKSLKEEVPENEDSDGTCPLE